MPYAEVTCKHCGRWFRPYPYEIVVFLRDRLHEDFWYMTINSRYRALLLFNLKSRCPYCREVAWGKKRKIPMKICPHCGILTSRGFCPACGRPLEICSVLFVQVNLKGRPQNVEAGRLRACEWGQPVLV